MLDQTPGEMIIALRQGEIDLALTLHGIDLLSREFYARKIATVRSLVALPVSHRFASERQGLFVCVRGTGTSVSGVGSDLMRVDEKFTSAHHPGSSAPSPAASLHRR